MNPQHKQPKEGVEYMFILESTSKVDSFEQVRVPKGTIVKNLQLTDSGYQFNIDGVAVPLKTYYGWALIENTPENQERFKKFEEMREEAERYAKEVQKQFNTVECLHNPEGIFDHSISESEG